MQVDHGLMVASGEYPNYLERICEYVDEHDIGWTKLTKYRYDDVCALSLIRPDVQNIVIDKMKKDIRSLGFSYNTFTTSTHQIGVLWPAIFSRNADEDGCKKVTLADIKAANEDDIEKLCGVKSHEDRDGWKFWTQQS